MSEAIWDEIAEAVVQELNTNPWRLAFTARRVEDNTIDLPDADTLHVDVMPGEVKVVAASDEATQYDCMMDVAVRKRFGVSDQEEDTGEIDQAEIDLLRGMVQDIAEYFHQRELQDVAAVCVGEVFNPHGSPAMLREQRQFTAIVKLTFRAFV